MLDMRCASFPTGYFSTSRACYIGGWPLLPSMARVYADVNQHIPRAC